MNVIYFLIPISLLFAGAFLWAFIWAVRSGQYDDTNTPSMRVLFDEPAGRRAAPSPERRAAEPARLEGVGINRPDSAGRDAVSETFSMPTKNIPS